MFTVFAEADYEKFHNRVIPKYRIRVRFTVRRLKEIL